MELLLFWLLEPKIFGKKFAIPRPVANPVNPVMALLIIRPSGFGVFPFFILIIDSYCLRVTGRKRTKICLPFAKINI